MKKTWKMAAGLAAAFLLVSVWPGRAAGQTAQSAAGNGKKTEVSGKTLTDTELRQLARKEVTLTDTWLAANGYSRKDKDAVLKQNGLYEKDGVYYFQKGNRLVNETQIPGIEMGVELQLKRYKKQPVKK